MNSPGPTQTPAEPAGNSHSLKGQRGLRRVLNATRYSRDGLRAAWQHEDAFRQELVLAAIMIPTALLLPVTLVDKLLLIGVVAPIFYPGEVIEIVPEMCKPWLTIWDWEISASSLYRAAVDSLSHALDSYRSV